MDSEKFTMPQSILNCARNALARDGGKKLPQISIPQKKTDKEPEPMTMSEAIILYARQQLALKKIQEKKIKKEINDMKKIMKCARNVLARGDKLRLPAISSTPKEKNSSVEPMSMSEAMVSYARRNIL